MVKECDIMGKYVHAGVGISKADDPAQAGKEAVEMALGNMKKDGGKKPTFGILFCSAKKYAQSKAQINKLVKSAHKTFGCEWIGCTTAGEISNYGKTQESCVVLTVSTDYLRIGIGVGKDMSKDPKKAGSVGTKNALNKVQIDKYLDPYISYMKTKKMSTQHLIKTKPYSILMMSPGTTINNIGFESEIIRGIVDIVGAHTPIIGGSAGDDELFKQTYQFANGVLYIDAVIIATFLYDVFVNFTAVHGCVPTKKSAVVTKAKGKIVMELDNKPAIEVYAKLTGKSIKEVKEKAAWVGIELPFGICDTSGKYWIKSPQAAVNNSLMFFSEIPENVLLVLMQSNKRQFLAATDEGISELLLDVNANQAAFAVLFDCDGRKNVLGSDAEKEVNKIKKGLKDTPFIGFYTYAEQGFGKIMSTGNLNLTLTGQLVTDKLLTE